MKLLSKIINKFKNQKVFIIFSISNLVIYYLFIFVWQLDPIFSSYFSLNFPEKKCNTKDIACFQDSIRKIDQIKMQNKDPFIDFIPDYEDVIDTPIIDSLDPYLGKDETPINIVYFSSFSCQACFEQELLIYELMDKYKDKLSFTWKDNPDTDKTSWSYRASLAARCAQSQGKFWDYHDLLYEAQKKLSEKNLEDNSKSEDNLKEDLFLQIAYSLELNLDIFESCFLEESKAQLVEDNIMESIALGVLGTPFTYFNDQGIMGIISQDELEMMIKLELDKINENLENQD